MQNPTPVPESLFTSANSYSGGDYITPFRLRSRNQLWLMVREGRRFILKGLPENLRSHPEEYARLRKEYSIGLRINNPGVAGVYGFEKTEATGPVIVMEYVDGVPLDEFLGSDAEDSGNGAVQKIDVRTKIASQIADALLGIHVMGISHRDLKPDNILVTRSGHDAKIIDFGNGDCNDAVYYKQSLGTSEFGAPEQQSPSEGDQASDVYSFGKLLEILLPERRYRSVIRACLQEDPEDRPQMAEVAAMLSKASSMPIRGSWIFMAAVALLLAVSLSGIYFFSFRKLAGYPEAERVENDSSATYIPVSDDHATAPDAVAPVSKTDNGSRMPDNNAPDAAVEVEKVDYDKIYEGYIAKVDGEIKRFGPLQVEIDENSEMRKKYDRRTAITFTLGDNLKKELIEKGASLAVAEQMYNAYWMHVNDKINSMDNQSFYESLRGKRVKTTPLDVPAM